MLAVRSLSLKERSANAIVTPLVSAKGLGGGGVRADGEPNRVGFAAFELPFIRVENQQQTILISDETDPEAGRRPGHGAVVEFVRLVGRRNAPRADSHGLTFLRLSECRRSQDAQTNE